MSFWPRFYLWLIVALLIPIGILIYEGGYNVDAMRWIVGVTILALIVETIFEIQKRGK